MKILRNEKGSSDDVAFSLFAGFLVVAIIGSLFFAVPWFFRFQRLKGAENQVHLNNIRIRQTEQLVQVEQQKAEIRIVEAKGIASAQAIINATLTPLYLQHEAIKAQERMAGSPNHTQIYVPTGSNGIPLVFTAPPVVAK